MFRKSALIMLAVFVLLFAAMPAFAQGTEPTPVPQVDEYDALLIRLGIFAAFGSAALTLLKPVILNRLSEELAPNVYLGIVYLIRLIGGGITLAFFGGVMTLYQVAPSLETLPVPAETRDAVVFVGAMIILSLGQEGIYVMLNILRSLAGLPPVGTVETTAERAR